VFPSGDQGEVDLTLAMPASTDISATDGVVRQLESRLRAYPEVRRVYSHTGSSGGATALASGASANAPADAHMSVLGVAALYGRTEVVKALAGAGADVTAALEQGQKLRAAQ